MSMGGHVSSVLWCENGNSSMSTGGHVSPVLWCENGNGERCGSVYQDGVYMH